MGLANFMVTAHWFIYILYWTPWRMELFQFCSLFCPQQLAQWVAENGHSTVKWLNACMHACMNEWTTNAKEMKGQDRSTIFSPALLGPGFNVSFGNEEWLFHSHLSLSLIPHWKPVTTFEGRDQTPAPLHSMSQSCLEHFEQYGEKDAGVLLANCLKVHQLLLDPEIRLIFLAVCCSYIS